MAQRRHLETVLAFFGIKTGWSKTDTEAMTLAQAVAQMYAIGNQQGTLL